MSYRTMPTYMMYVSLFFQAIVLLSFYPGHSRIIGDRPASSWGITRDYKAPDICTECSQIADLFTGVMSNNDIKETTYITLQALCRRCPSEQASYCLAQMEKYFPKGQQYRSGLQKPGEACVVLGLCQPGRAQVEPVHTDTHTPSAVSDSGTSQQVGDTPVCTLCLYVIRKLVNMLPLNRTEEAILKAMGEVCDLIPHEYKHKCNDLIDKYGKEIVELLLSSAAPHTICSMLHLCLINERPGIEMLPASDCDSCRTLAVMSRLQLGLNATDSETSSFLLSVCIHQPNAIPKCETFVRLYRSRLQKVLGNQMSAREACERADLCVAKRSAPMLGVEPCTWGPSYWCQDRTTAQKCGNQAFCEKFIWK